MEVSRNTAQRRKGNASVQQKCTQEWGGLCSTPGSGQHQPQHGKVGMVVFGQRMDFIILDISSNLSDNDSGILPWEMESGSGFADQASPGWCPWEHFLQAHQEVAQLHHFWTNTGSISSAAVSVLKEREAPVLQELWGAGCCVPPLSAILIHMQREILRLEP